MTRGNDLYTDFSLREVASAARRLSTVSSIDRGKQIGASVNDFQVFPVCLDLFFIAFSFAEIDKRTAALVVARQATARLGVDVKSVERLAADMVLKLVKQAREEAEEDT